MGFVRLSMRPAVVKMAISFRDVTDVLARMIGQSAHRFWVQDEGFLTIRPEIRNRIIGHNQITDSILLDLAIRHQGRLATFDRGIPNLLPPGSELRAAVSVISTD